MQMLSLYASKNVNRRIVDDETLINLLNVRKMESFRDCPITIQCSCQQSLHVLLQSVRAVV